MQKIFEYVKQAEGREWTSADTACVKRELLEVEMLIAHLTALVGEYVENQNR